MHQNPFSAGAPPRSPDPAGGAYDAPPDPLVGWGGDTPSPYSSPLDAFGVSVLRPPQHKILATPVTVLCIFVSVRQSALSSLVNQ